MSKEAIEFYCHNCKKNVRCERPEVEVKVRMGWRIEVNVDAVCPHCGMAGPGAFFMGKME